MNLANGTTYEDLTLGWGDERSEAERLFARSAESARTPTLVEELRLSAKRLIKHLPDHPSWFVPQNVVRMDPLDTRDRWSYSALVASACSVADVEFGEAAAEPLREAPEVRCRECGKPMDQQAAVELGIIVAEPTCKCAIAKFTATLVPKVSPHLTRLDGGGAGDGRPAGRLHLVDT